MVAIKEKVIPLNEYVDLYANTIKFLNLIHGDRAYEIRLLEEGSQKDTFSKSFLVYGDDVYSEKKIYTTKLTNKNNNIWMEILLRDYWTKYGTVGFNDFGVFFTPNSPEFDKIENCILNDKAIKYINCQFIDIDAPDEIRKDKESLKIWKREQCVKVKNWNYPPSIIVISKNGIHCYWLVNEGKKELFRYIQLQLAYYFNGDLKCQNPSRVLRLPLFMHRKDRKDQFAVYIYKMENILYTQEQFIKALPKIPEEIIRESVKKQREKKSVTQLGPGQEKRLWKLVKNHIEIGTETNKKITCKCPMPEHEDKKPSAWIDKEYQWFHCSSTYCGVSKPLEELAEELDWNDVLEEINRPKYQINIRDAFLWVKKFMVNVSDCRELELSKFEEEFVDNVTSKIFKVFLDRSQVLNNKHKQYIRDIVKILYKGKQSEIPDLVPLDMGGGKSTVVEVYVSEMLKINPNYGVIIVKERIEDAVNTAQKINSEIGKNLAYAIYGFRQEECKKGLSRCDLKYRKKNDKLIKYSRCENRKECRYYNQYTEQQKYPVLIITHERLFDEVRNDTLTYKYRFFNKVFVREKLIIDEKPKLIYNNSLTKKQFEKYSQCILDHLILTNDEAYKEFKNMVEMVESIFQHPGETRENINPINDYYVLSKNFWIEFNSMAHYKDEYHNFPKMIENLIKYGGHKTSKKSKKGEIKIVVNTSHYCNYTYGNQFHSIIFDGTADIDFMYRHKKYRIFNFEHIREYNNFYFYECNYLKSTKNEMSKDNILVAFIKQVQKIAEQHPDSKIYLPVFLDNEKIITEKLKDYISIGQIKIAHFGATKGRNDFFDCDIVIMEGILHKTEDYYISIHRAVTNSFANDLEAKFIDGVRRFNNKGIEHFKITDQNVDYSQEIKRSMQRDNSKDITGKVYIFTNDTYLLDILKWKLPGSRIVKWNPEEILEERILGNNHSQAKNGKLIINFFKRNKERNNISFQELKKDVNLTTENISRELRKPLIIGCIESLGFNKIKDGREVFFIK